MALEVGECSDQDYGLAFSATPGDVDQADQNYHDNDFSGTGRFSLLNLATL
jgi:hypothetical protein